MSGVEKMARGGRRAGAGRPPGARNKRTIARLRLAKGQLEAGIAPLEYMLSIMRDESQPQERRDEMAKAAAPYVHPRLNATDLRTESIRYVVALPQLSTSSDEWLEQHRPKYLEHQPMKAIASNDVALSRSRMDAELEAMSKALNGGGNE